MIFLRGDNAAGIWNKKKGKIIVFENDKFSTDDDFEIALLKDNGYKELKELKEVKETKEIKEVKKVDKPKVDKSKVDKPKGKPGRPKTK